MIRTIFKEASTGMTIATIMLPAAFQKDDVVELPNGYTYIVASTAWKITGEMTSKGISIPTLVVRLR